MKKIYYLIISLSMSIGFGQAPTLDWLNTFGETSLSAARRIVTTSDGGYIVAGIKSTLDFYGDVWLFKLNSSGDLVWENTYGGLNPDVAYGIVEIVGEGFLIAGYSGSSDGDVTTNHGGDDIWVFKIDYSGNIIWEKSYGGTLDEKAFKIIPGLDGGFILVGSSESNNYDLTANYGGEDIWIFKIDHFGNIVWQKTYGGTLNEYLYDITPTLDGNYIVCGSTTSNDGDITENHGNNEFWVLKIDRNGNILWQSTYGGSDNDYATGVVSTLDGGFLVSGTTYSTNGDISDSQGDADIWIVKLDAVGNLTWEKNFGGTGNDNGIAIISDVNEGFVLAGTTSSNDGDVTDNFGGFDIWIFKIDNIGNLKWQQSFGGSSIDNIMDIITTNYSDYLFCGNTFSVDGDMAQNEGGLHSYVAKLLNNELSTNYYQLHSIKVYPNPISSYVTITTTNKSIIESIYVFDINSRVVLRKDRINNDTVDLNTSILTSGIYFVKIQTNSGNQTAKVVKQ